MSNNSSDLAAAELISQTVQDLRAAGSVRGAEHILEGYLAGVSASAYAGCGRYEAGSFLGVRWAGPVPVELTQLCDACQATGFWLDVELVAAAAAERDRVQALIDLACLVGPSLLLFDAPRNRFLLHCRSVEDALASRELLTGTGRVLSPGEPPGDDCQPKLRALMASASWIALEISDEPVLVDDWH